MMAFGPRLSGERVVLRELQPTDRAARQAFGRHAEIQRMFGAPHPKTRAMTIDETEQWVAGLGGDNVIEWIVEHQGSFVGNARLHSFDGDSARYAIGLFDPALLGQGLGTEVTKLVLGYAFDQLDLDRVSLAALSFNERAIGCYAKCGFMEIGREPAAVVVDGIPADDVIMAITSDQFRDHA
jgi:RimJ/RimL family protein N-acetyltransferase